MIGRHFQAILWLRWRILRNQLSRAGKANQVVAIALLVLLCAASAASFFAALGLGVYLLPRATPEHVLYVWNAWILVFCFFWMVGVGAELQRSESISLEKLLHFPISLGSAFLLNYFHSCISGALILLLPGLVGLSIAAVVAIGPDMLVTFPLLAGFVLMVTALTYQFRGWLGALMVNKRRRRTIATIFMGLLIVLSQLPSVLNIAFSRRLRQSSDDAAKHYLDELRQLDRALKSRQIDPQQYKERAFAAEKSFLKQRGSKERSTLDAIRKWTTVVDLALPPGWLAYGTAQAAEHRVWPGICGAAGLCAIAALSLRRSYRSTLRFYRGELQPARRVAVPPQTSNAPRTIASTAGMRKDGPPKSTFVGRRLPGLSDPAAATALATLRSLLRAPEVKMLLLTPIFTLAPLFVAFLFRPASARSGPPEMPPIVRVLVVQGIVLMGTITLSQLPFNQFGYDREAFRTFILCPARRRDIVLGKNLALAPFVLGLGILEVAAGQCLFPLNAMHLLARAIQLLAAYLLCCMAGNYASIQVPSAVRAGSMKASSPGVSTTLARFVVGVLLMISFAGLFIPPLVEYGLQAWGLPDAVPVDLVLSALDCAGLVVLYRHVLERQGAWLQRREAQILAAVTRKND